MMEGLDELVVSRLDPFLDTLRRSLLILPMSEAKFGKPRAWRSCAFESQVRKRHCTNRCLRLPVCAKDGRVIVC